MCNNKGSFKELDIPTCKQVNSLPLKNVRYCAVTFDNKFFITAGNGRNCILTIWSIRSKKQLHTWQSGFDCPVRS